MLEIASRLWKHRAVIKDGSEVANLTEGKDGNKGIISMIIDDEKMPQTVDGERAEICLNTLGSKLCSV